MSRHTIVALPGDGIGPEVLGAARRLLDAVAARFGAQFEVEELPIGGVSIDEHGVPLLPGVLDRCRASDAVLLGAVGGPKWDSTDPHAPRPEQGLLGLRKGLDLFANLRPVRVSRSLIHASPLREQLVRDADLLIVRELTGGIYFGDRGRRDGVAHDTCVYSTEEIERIADLALRLAASPARRGKVVSVDKANILETSRLWRETVDQVARRHERVDRARFWANFGAIAAVLAAILGVIALVVALQAKDDANNAKSNGGNNAALRSDVNTLQSDVASLKSKTSSTANVSGRLDKISTRLDRLSAQVTSISDAQAKTDTNVTKLQTDLTDLTKRVDQVQKAQEQQAAGGP